MNRAKLLSTAFVGMTLAFACFTHHAGAGKAEKSDSKVKATAIGSKIGADGKQTVNITLAIENPWYIYANPVGEEILEGARTKVSFKAKDKVMGSISYPPGKEKTDKTDKATLKYQVYQGSVTIQAQVQRTMGDSSPLEISIDVNACHPGDEGKSNGVCLPTGTVKVSIP